VDGSIGRVQRIIDGEGGRGGSSGGDVASESVDSGGKTKPTKPPTKPPKPTPLRNASPKQLRKAPPKPPGDDDKNGRGGEGGQQNQKNKNEGRQNAAGSTGTTTVYLSNIPKVLSKSDVQWLVGDIPGVSGLRLPKRGGKNMGYSFIKVGRLYKLHSFYPYCWQLESAWFQTFNPIK
jgi:hypothetical protein